MKTWKGGLGKKKKKEDKNKSKGQPVAWTNFLPELKLFERGNNHVLEMMFGHVSLSLKRKNVILCYYPFEP